MNREELKASIKEEFRKTIIYQYILVAGFPKEHQDFLDTIVDKAYEAGLDEGSCKEQCTESYREGERDAQKSTAEEVIKMIENMSTYAVTDKLPERDDWKIDKSKLVGKIKEKYL